MLRVAFFAVVLALLAPNAALAATPTECSRVEADARRTLCHELIVQASTDGAWALFASSEGLQSWMAPLAMIDLRIGGLWETAYRPGARVGDADNVRNRILSYAPGRMLSIAVDHAPEGFIERERVRTLWTVIEFEPVSDVQTRVRVSMFGFADDPGYDQLYRFFQAGNTLTLRMLEQRITNGPTDWSALAAAARP
jgi:uncharacterized protein YndB with AHSA1/START domain